MKLIMLYIKLGKNLTQIFKKKKAYLIYGKDSVTDRMCQKKFEKFRA